MIARERPCPDDLLARAHRPTPALDDPPARQSTPRATLSDLERQVLAIHLRQCADCRAASAMARMFDETADERPGDAALIARLADETATRLPSGANRGARRRALVVAAALALLLATSVRAAWNVWRRPSPSGPRATPAEPTAPAAPRVPGAGVHRVDRDTDDEAGASSTSAADRSPTGDHLPGRERHPRRRAPGARPESLLAPAAAAAGPAPDGAPRGARALFAEANGERRSGRLRRAIDLYHDLQRRFPDADEARLASIPLGDLLLRLDEPTGALAAFDFYLSHSPAGVLTEEALFGRGRCLKELGRAADERAAWQRLLGLFPQSAYEPVARRRLHELQP